MARQYLQDGGPLEPAITDPKAASAVTTAEGAWNSLQYTLIPAYDPRPGKVYIVEAGGLITTAATGALTLAPSISTTNAAGTTLGSSIAQTVPASSLSGPWYLRLVLVVLTTGAPGGTNSTIKGTGFFQSGGVAATASTRPRSDVRWHVGRVRSQRQPVDLLQQDAERRRVVDDAVVLLTALN
jgi:hypothetical protein